MLSKREVARSAAIGKALRLRRDIDAFEAKWPAPKKRSERIPSVDWDQLQRQLVDLAPTTTQASLVSRVVADIRAYAPYKPPELVLREILCAAVVLLDEGTPEAGTMDAEPLVEVLEHTA